MAPTPFVRWTDISDAKTSLQELIRLLNRRLGKTTFENIALCHVVIGDGVTVIPTGVFGDIPFDQFPATITSWTMVGTLPLATNGSITLDLWRKRYGGEATVSDTICTPTTKPIITTARQARSADVKAWSPVIALNDVIRVNVDSNAVFTQISFSMTMAKG